MWLLLLAWLLCLSPGVRSVNYYLEGHLGTISAAEVKGISHEQFLLLEAKIGASLKEAVKDRPVNFELGIFEIHAEYSAFPTAIFQGHVQTDINRKDILARLESTPLLTIFYLREIDQPPLRSRLLSSSEDAGVSQCNNGGILLPNSTCDCPTFYSGSMCESIQCFHQGISDGGKCFCPPGVYALNCEPRACLPAVQNTLDVSQRTLMLVLNTNTSMAYVLNSVITNIGTLLNQTTYANFVLTTYVSGETFNYMNTKYFRYAADLQSYLLGTVHVSNGLNVQPTNRAILQTQSYTGKMKPLSNILVFTDGLDSEDQGNNYILSDNTTENLLILKTIAWRSRIVYLLSQSPSNPMPVDGAFASYRRVAQSTLGDIVSYDNTEINAIMLGLLSAYQNVEVTDAFYANPRSVTRQLHSDDHIGTEPINILITVDPNGILPTISPKGLKSMASGKRFLLYSATRNSASELQLTANGSPYNFKTFVGSIQTGAVSYTSDINVDVGDAFTPADLDTYVTAGLLGVSSYDSSMDAYSVLWKDITTAAISNTFEELALRKQECSFYYVSRDTGRCTPGPFIQEISFEDDQGFPRYRLVPGYCVSLEKPSPASFVCLNGGSNNSTSSCECASGYAGDHCEIPQCQNGGSVNPFPGNGLGPCTCPTGYSGDLCDILSCKVQSHDTFDNTRRSFAMVMQTSMSQAQIASSINQGLSTMLSMLAGNESFNQHILTTFNVPAGQNKSVWSTNIYADPSQYATAVNNVNYLASSANSFDSFAALYSAMMMTANDRSSFFLFVDSPPSGTIQEMDIAWYAVTHQFEISVIITPPYNMSGLCIQDITPFLTIVQKTGGVIYNLCAGYTPNGQDPIVEFFRGFGASHHHTENIAETYSPSCRAASTLSFFVDDPSSDVNLIVNSDATQEFIVGFMNNDNGINVPLSPISSTPFISVYKLPIYISNKNGYKVTVLGGVNTTYGECYTRIAGKTKVAVFIGFSKDPSQDSLTKTLTYATKVYPVAHISTPIDGSVFVDALDDRADLAYYSKDTKRASSCSYESYFKTPLICDSVDGTYIVDIKTATPSGAVIQRSRRTFCYLGQQQCLNGGTYLAGKCVCPAGKYQGDSCEYPICQNNGELNEFQCMCENTAGDLCQYEVCNSFNYMEDADPREVDYKQITFVINTNADQLLVQNYVQNWLQQFVNQTDSGKNKMFSLITFDGYTVKDVATTVDKDEFVSIFQQTTAATTWAAATTTVSLDALAEALKINIDPPSIIYLFTGTNAARSTTTTSQLILRQRVGTQVNVIYSPQNDNYPGQPGGSYGFYLSIAVRQSGGRIWPLTQNTMGQIEQPLAATVSENALLFDDAESDCSAGVVFSFIMESTFTTAYFDISGNDVSLDGNVVITDAGGSRAPMDMIQSQVKDNSLLLLSMSYSGLYATGNWSIRVKTSSGSCYVQVRTVSPVRIVPGFTSDQNNDFVKELPFIQFGTNQLAYMTFRLVDRSSSTTYISLDRVDISSGDFDRPWSGRKFLQSLKIRPRTQPPGCASQFVSDSWKLDKATFQKFVVYGSDIFGTAFQRTYSYYLSPTDKTISCQNGARNANGECICDAQHSGDFCADRLCQNGGSQSYGLCVCPNGYYGDYCEQLVASGTPSTAGTSHSVGPTTVKPATTLANGPTTAVVNGPTTTVANGPTTTVVNGPTTTLANGPTTVVPVTSAKTTVTTTGVLTSTAPPSTAAPPTSTVTVPKTTTTVSTTAPAVTLPPATSSAPLVTTTAAGQTLKTATTGPSTKAQTTTAPTSTTATTTTTKPGSTTPVRCDPYDTRYMISLFLDATNLFADDGSGTYYVREDPIVKSLAAKLDLGTGIGGSRFLFNGVTSDYHFCGNVTSVPGIDVASPCLGNGVDRIYDLTNALFEYLLLGNNWQPGPGESPPIAIVFANTPILNGSNSAQPYVSKLQSKGYKFLGVDVSTDGSQTAQLVQLFGTNNVYHMDTADSTAQWLRNNICLLKPF